MNSGRLMLAALLLGCAGPVVAHGGNPDDATADYRFGDEASLDRRIEEVRADYGIIGGAVAAGRSDRVLYERAFGFADREEGRAATTDTPFALASVTKPITAIAIMMLVDEGKVDLDAPVNRYLGDNRVRATFGRADEITVRRVMSHTAGLPFLYELSYADAPQPLPDFAGLMDRYGYTILPPGVSSQYSNLGYEILAEIVTRQSGMPWREFVDSRIFGPLELSSASIALAAARPEDAAQRYMVDGSIVPDLDTSHRGAASAYMSVSDLLKLGQFWLRAYRGESRLLSRASAVAMATNSEGELAAGAGHGFFLEDYKGTLYVSHGGSMAGTKARLGILPEKDLVIAVLLNEQNSYAEAFLGEEMIRSFEPAHNFYWNPPRAPSALQGKWSGTIGGNGPIARLDLDFTDLDHPLARIDGNEVAVRSAGGEGPYRFRLDGAIDDAGFGVPHDLRFFLIEHGEGLVGEVRLEPLPQMDRANGGVGYWVKLSRVE